MWRSQRFLLIPSLWPHVSPVLTDRRSSHVLETGVASSRPIASVWALVSLSHLKCRASQLGGQLRLPPLHTQTEFHEVSCLWQILLQTDSAVANACAHVLGWWSLFWQVLSGQCVDWMLSCHLLSCSGDYGLVLKGFLDTHFINQSVCLHGAVSMQRIGRSIS